MNNKELRGLKEQMCNGLNQVQMQFGEIEANIKIEPKNLILAGIQEVDDICGYDLILTNLRFEFRRKEDRA